jgi:hypothetical protein
MVGVRREEADDHIGAIYGVYTQEKHNSHSRIA